MCYIKISERERERKRERERERERESMNILLCRVVQSQIQQTMKHIQNYVHAKVLEWDGDKDHY